MKKNLYMRKIWIGAFVVVFTACQKKAEENTSQPSAIESSTASNFTDAPTTYTTSNPVQAGVKLNPPHGEPGHICEIAVGAPLPQVGELPEPVQEIPDRPTPVMPTSTSILNQPINTSVPVGPKPQFNPPHGQPWHTCDLEVGAPLK
jgi:hypothetical protein